MSNQSKLDNDVKFRPNYKWPKEGTEKKCPKLDEPLQLKKNLPQYILDNESRFKEWLD